jgi:hypothetical protein
MNQDNANYFKAPKAPDVISLMLQQMQLPLPFTPEEPLEGEAEYRFMGSEKCFREMLRDMEYSPQLIEEMVKKNYGLNT